MPKLGLTMTEGRISKWCKAEGEAVKVGDVLFEVSTDKITNQVEADAEGVLLKQLLPENADAPVTAPVGIIGAPGEDISGLTGGSGTTAAEAREEKVSTIQHAAPQASAADSFVKASPAAKKLARDNKLDVSLVKGTGPDGRIVERDVLAYLEGIKKQVKISPAAAKMASDLGVDVSAIDKQGRIMKEDILMAVKPDFTRETAVTAVEDTSVRPSAMRRVIAERMSASWSTSPRVTFNMEADVSNLKAFRNSLKDASEKGGVKLSYNHILIKICAKALGEFPYINASFNGSEIILHRSVNVGLAVSVEGGLVVPNVKDVQSKPLFQIARETEDLIAASRKNTLTADDMTGGTFTITNLGMYGMESFSPIINQPELAILGVNAMIDKPVVVEGQIVIRPMMNLSLTADHRVVDGAEAARFLARIKQLIENPYLLLL
jgi:pyruvate dehydrogenase E2 component (dihydrolipoamide acetyltransferase)